MNRPVSALIVGGAGYIGSHIVHDLTERGARVLVFDDLSSGDERNIPASAEFLRGNLLNNDEVLKALSFSPDAVFHFAAKKAVGESMEDPAKYALNNLNGTVNLLSGMLDKGIGNFIFSSSAAVYGSPTYLPIDEQHPCAPENYYGYTKLAIEENLSWFSRLKGLRYTSLRYFNASGYDVARRIKTREVGTSNLSPVIMETAAGIRTGFQLFGNDYETRDGTCIRDYIHVNDLSSAHLLAMDYLLEGGESICLNLGTETGTTVLEMIKAAEAVTGLSINYEISGRRPGDAGDLVASSRLARELLGWNPKHSDIETILGSMKYVYGLD